MRFLQNRIATTRLFCAILFAYYLLGINKWNLLNPIVEETLFMIGSLLIAAGVIGRSWSLSYIAGKKDDILIQEGPYSICRNPLYLFSFIGAVGIGFCTETFTVPLIIVAAFASYYPFTIRKEEAELKARFGHEYENYLKRVRRRMIPGFRNYMEPEKLEISPKAFRKGLFDLVYFIVFMGVFEMLEAFHVMGWIPAYYGIY